MRESKPDAIWFLADARGGGQTVRTKHWQRPEDAGMAHNIFRVHRVEEEPDLSRLRWDRRAGAFVDDAVKLQACRFRDVLELLADPLISSRIALGQVNATARTEMIAALAWKDSQHGR